MLQHGRLDNDGKLLRITYNGTDPHARPLQCPHTSDFNQCGLWCPLFGLTKDSKGTYVYLGCAPQETGYVIIP